MIKRNLALLAVMFAFVPATAQWYKTVNDSAYVEDYTQDLTVRVYGSRKYNYYDLKDRDPKKELLYRPNTGTNLGFGANYKFVGLNIGFNFPFINNRHDKYGETKYLDLQAHLYLRKFVVDFYGQYYKGYYEAERKPSAFNSVQQGLIALRPDLENKNIGLSFQYIFNDERFSYRAAYLQNEYQKRSAGSLIVGAEAFAWQMRGDSALIPSNYTEGFFDDEPFTQSGAVSLAMNIGYAHTFVILRHFFITASLSAAGGISHSGFRYDDGRPRMRGFGWQLNNTVRFAAGYNARRWFAGLHYVDMMTRSRSPIPGAHQNFGAGNMRFSVVRRFTLKKPLIGKF
ncbi:DUF4421 domain-containing protein [Chitinophaga cymbidii]|uniref:DUF4421 domain-containing protein n=1 Tax=Chitinophaga cymbidii TaxID=1096750 RepID=A0A512RDH7_9BACT|nr:DUF4421 domain-containing protein [Chitinophaga cymbidii]GEP93768.1 hypothetical protein CCY01nite_00280 [Chitinophaga cymbidii]